MYVNEQRKFIFLAHPKTASRAVREALRERHGFVPHRHSVAKDWAIPPGGIAGHHRPLAAHPGPDWTTFTVVRNHWDAWVSWWYYAGRKRYPVFGIDYMRFQMQKPGSNHYWSDPHRMWALHGDVADHLLRYETLERDLTRLLGEPVVLPTVGVSPGREGRHYRTVHTPETRDWVAEQFREEIEALGYVW